VGYHVHPGKFSTKNLYSAVGRHIADHHNLIVDLFQRIALRQHRPQGAK
jgi:hypothetical protein